MAAFFPSDSRGNHCQMIFRSDVMMARFNTQGVSDFRAWDVRMLLGFSSPNVLKLFALAPSRLSDVLPNCRLLFARHSPTAPYLRRARYFSFDSIIAAMLRRVVSENHLVVNNEQ
jgi:hypothetical protein